MNSYRTSLALLMVSWFAMPLSAVADRSWDVLEDCTLVTGRYNDGDSFHVRHEGRERIFRLYYVDSPETDETLDDRISEQAGTFHIGESEVVRYGKAAGRFTASALGGRRFTVYTRWKDAMGSSRMKRYFAFVKVDGEFLAELLVKEGLARVYGVRAPRPDGASVSQVLNVLDRLQNEARGNRVGAWGGKSGSRKEKGPSPIERALGRRLATCNRVTPVFSLKDPSRQVQLLRKGQTVGIMGEGSNGMVRVRFKSPLRDQLYEAQCRPGDLDKQKP